MRPTWMGVLLSFAWLGSAGGQSGDCTEFKKQWEAHKTLGEEYCSHADDTNDMAKWNERRRGYAEKNVKATWAAFAKKHGSCFRSPYNLAGDLARDCERAEEKYAEIVRVLATQRLGQLEHDIGYLKEKEKEGAWGIALNQAEGLLKDLRELSAVVTDNADLKRATAEMEDRVKTYQAKVQEGLAKNKCPAKDANKGLSKKMLPIFQAYLDKNTQLQKETAKTFRVSGKSRTEVEVGTGVTYEYVPATACVEQTSDRGTKCRIFDVTMVRSKPRGGAFGEWGYHSIGGGDEMLCQNVK